MIVESSQTFHLIRNTRNYWLDDHLNYLERESTESEEANEVYDQGANKRTTETTQG